MKEKGKNKLTPKQRLFVKEYLVDLNATQAAIRAGYSKKTAMQMGEENLRKPVIQASLQLKMAEREKKVDFSAEGTLRELKNIVHFNIKNIFDEHGKMKSIKELDDSTAAAIAGIEFTSKMDGDDLVRVTKIRLNDKNKAIDSAMRHFSLYNDKLNVGVSFNDVLAAFPEDIRGKIKEEIAKKLHG